FYNPRLGEDTGFAEGDMKLFWDALEMCWDLDRSASRGTMALRGVYIFTHDDEKGLGNAPAHKLFSRITAKADTDGRPPRKFEDYTVSINEEDLPDGITLTRLAE